MELWNRAGELGDSSAYNCVARAYITTEKGVERDTKKAINYYELAAMGGDAFSRHNLGNLEKVAPGNADRACEAHTIAEGSGLDQSLKARWCFEKGCFGNASIVNYSLTRCRFRATNKARHGTVGCTTCGSRP